MRGLASARELRGLELRLRRDRPQAGGELLAAISDRLAGSRSRTGSFRVVFAGALTAAVATALAAVGGFSYAANAAQQAVEAVKRVVSPQAAISVSGITAGGDQYRPGFGWGDPNHNHTGPPGLQRQGGNFAPPLRAARTRDRLAAIVSTRVTISEQAFLSIFVVDPRGRRLLLTQSSRRGCSTVGQGVKGPQTKVILYRMLVPRTIPLRLRIPRSQLRPNVRHRIIVQARDPDGNKRRLAIPFVFRG